MIRLSVDLFPLQYSGLVVYSALLIKSSIVITLSPTSAITLLSISADKKSNSLKDIFTQAQPIQRAGNADDIANMVAFLASDEATFVTSSDHLVDGGMIGGRQFSITKERMEALSDIASG